MAAPIPIPADAPALRPADPRSSPDEDGSSVAVRSGSGALLLLLLLPLSLVVAAEGKPPIVPDDDDEDVEELAVEELAVEELAVEELAVEERAVEAVDVDEVCESASSPNTIGPPLRSSPMRLNAALFMPSMPSSPVRTLNQQGVVDVKLSSMGTVAVFPGAFCW
jgi:hypothetical protein